MLILWAGDNSYRYSLMQTAAAYALIGVGVYIPFIMGGSLSLAYAAYASIGGYSVALIADKTSLPVVIGWVIGPIVAGFAAVVLGQLTRRLSGLYLAAITYLFAQAFQSWLNSAPGITGGEAGIGNLRPTSLLGWIPGDRGQIVLAVVLVLAVGFVVDRLRLSPWGVSLRAMKEVPAAVEATGIRVPMLTLVALGLGAAVASIGGALFTTATSVDHPEHVHAELDLPGRVHVAARRSGHAVGSDRRRRADRRADAQRPVPVDVGKPARGGRRAARHAGRAERRPRHHQRRPDLDHEGRRRSASIDSGIDDLERRVGP